MRTSDMDYSSQAGTKYKNYLENKGYRRIKSIYSY